MTDGLSFFINDFSFVILSFLFTNIPAFPLFSPNSFRNATKDDLKTIRRPHEVTTCVACFVCLLRLLYAGRDTKKNHGQLCSVPLSQPLLPLLLASTLTSTSTTTIGIIHPKSPDTRGGPGPLSWRAPL